MRLSSDHASMKRGYDVIVVGSGYGGAICAARLAEAGRRVCVLERGKEWQVGSFPDHADAVAAEVRTSENPLGLFDYVVGDDLDVLVGNGLGGTSLINANVVIEPDLSVFDSPRWPRSLRADAHERKLEPFRDRFLAMVRTSETGPPRGWPAKVKCMSASATRLAEQATLAAAKDPQGRKVEARLEYLRVAVHMPEPGKADAAAEGAQRECTQCGDCVTGCNVGAKSTMMMNYLPHAKAHGAEIFTCMEAHFVLPAPAGGYLVYCSEVGDAADGRLRLLHAPVVVLAVGSLGSTGILLRSAERGLPLSARLGRHFSGNGDLLGIGYNNDRRCDGLGFGAHDDERRFGDVGPTILSAIHFTDTAGKPFLIEDGAVPRALVDLLRGLGGPIDALEGQDTDDGFKDKVGELARAARDWIGYSADGAANHTMIYLGMGHDGADGLLTLDAKGHTKVRWQGVAEAPVFASISEQMYNCVAALGGTYVRNPRFSEMFGRNLITVHPLGGCPMGDDAEAGVVNGFGEVWKPDGALHTGLFVADGAVIPDSLGVNPLLTISTLAERTAAHIVARADLARGAEVPALASATVPEPRLGLEFSEEMSGFVTPAVTTAQEPADFEAAFTRARAAPAGEGQRQHPDALRFRLTMFVDDIDAFLGQPAHEARAEGFVDSTRFGPARRVDRGRFNLFAPDPARPDVRRMLYSLRFTGADGRVYSLEGHKLVHDDRGFDVWADNTTLFTSIHAEEPGRPIVAQGILHIGVAGFLKLLSTIQVRNSPGPGASARVIGRFGRFFVGTVWDRYVAPKLRAGS